MEGTEQKKDFKKWLEYLQRESWQLELIISSILLVVLSNSDEIIADWLLTTTTNAGQGASILIMFPMLIYFSVIIAKTNLMIHIFLRGFWIGCLGLRYVSQDIDIDSLNYAPKFSNYLKAQGLDFDKYLENLEKICSIIFSFTFLLMFSVFSIFMFMFFVVTITEFFGYFDSPLLNKTGNIINTILLIVAFITLIDYAFLGYLKKQKYLAIVFYPIYRVFNFFSFSFIYRPLYYNFIDNTFGRKYLKLIIPYILLLMMVGEGLGIGEYKFLPDPKLNTNWIRHQFYEDKWEDDYGKSNVIISIPSMEIKDDFLPIYLKYDDTESIKKVIGAVCPSFEGYNRWSFQVPFIEGYNTYDDGKNKVVQGLKADIALGCVSQLFDLKIDTTAYSDPKFHFHEHSELKSKGLLTYLNIEDFEKGDHTLFVTKKVAYRDSAFVTRVFEIPFVKYN